MISNYFTYAHDLPVAALLIFIMLACSIMIERIAAPADRLTGRQPMAIVLHSIIFFSFYLLFFFLCRRVILSGMLVICGQLLIITISNAKYKALREPLVASDLILFAQAIKHPRLYLPFLGIIPAITMPLVVAAIIYFFSTIEDAIFSYPDIIDYSLIIFVIIAILSAGFILITSQLHPSLEAVDDIHHFGLISCLAIYFVHALKQSEVTQKSIYLLPLNSSSISDKPDLLPHIIVVQSESFFDVRRLHPSINPSILNNFDTCTSNSVYNGILEVPAWGAYTMRTEFSFLTGVSNHDLGLNKFDPYQAFRNSSVQTMASLLHDIGYQNICIHPNSAKFFSRDKLFPGMGFDNFIDISAFNSSQKDGPYIGDKAVTDKILEVLDNASRPLFIFAITMENHGPLHLESIQQSDIDNLYRSTPPEKSHDLTVYLRHLCNADIMIRRLCSHLASANRESVFCLYGDHIPSMPDVYNSLNYDNASTDYFIWKAKHSGTQKMNLAVESLGELLLSSAIPDIKTYFNQSSTR